MRRDNAPVNPASLQDLERGEEDLGAPFVVFDFEHRDALEVARLYGELALDLMDHPAQRMLLLSGARTPDGHAALRDALTVVLRYAGVPLAARLALLPQTPHAALVYGRLAHEFAGVGFNVRVFQSEAEALEWLCR